MSEFTISTELLRRVRHEAPTRLTDFRDPKVPGFVLRARPSGVHSWRVQLPNRRWLTLGRIDEVSLADAREEAQQRRAQAALGVDIPKRKSTSDLTLAQFLDQHYDAWMKATRRGRSTQIDRIRWAFKEFLDDKLSDITTGRVERLRAMRTNQRHPSARRKKPLSPVTVNQDIRARGIRGNVNSVTLFSTTKTRLTDSTVRAARESSGSDSSGHGQPLAC